ncbi:MAG: hypothetical protein IKI71_02650 [Lachnospiraceae bacterium]|nr:hypothetical protein [Lachnospiraceae bacterium]
MKRRIYLIVAVLICIVNLFSCGKKESVKETQVTTETTKVAVETTTKQKEIEKELNPEIKVATKEVDKKTSYNVVEFGKYDMEVGYSGPIEWLVVDRNADSYLLVSRYILDCKNYNNSDKEVTWDDATLNEWLNNYFLNSAFSSDEIAYMNYVKEFGLAGNAKVSLLNIAACDKYFGREDVEKRNYKLSAKATTWAKTNWQETVEAENSEYYDCGSFYLTDNGTTDRKAVWVGQYGHIYREGQAVKLEHGDGVRPVLVVKKELFETEQNIVREETSVSTKGGADETKTTIISSNAAYTNIAKEKHQSLAVPSSEKNVIDLSGWEYGRTPITWIYVAPNTQIISNNSPNRSANFGYKLSASSGEKGCYMTIFSKGESHGADWDGRFYCFEDYKKTEPEDMMFDTKFEDLKYGEYNIKELLSKRYKIEEVSDGVIKANGTYVNVIYVSELDDIIESMK